MFIICSLKSQATHGPFANNRYLCSRTRFPAGSRRHGIKRERLCKSGAIPVAVSSSIRRTLFSHCPDRGREGVRQERARRPALSEHRSRSSGTKEPAGNFLISKGIIYKITPTVIQNRITSRVATKAPAKAGVWGWVKFVNAALPRAIRPTAM